MTKYIRRIIVIVTAADRDAANAQAAMVDPDTGGGSTFLVPLSASGMDPPTHYAADTLVTLETLGQIEGMQATSFPTATIHRGHNEYDDEPGITRYTFDEVLIERELEKIEDLD